MNKKEQIKELKVRRAIRHLLKEGFSDKMKFREDGMVTGELTQDEVMTIYNNFMDTHKYKETVIDDPDGDKENSTLKIDTEDGKSYEVLTSAVGDEKWWEWGSGPNSSFVS